MCGVENLTPHKGNDPITQCDRVYMVRHSQGSEIVQYTHCRLWEWPHQKTNQSIRLLPPICKKAPASQAVLCSMQLTLHAPRRTPQGASRLVQAMSAWSVKTRRAPSQHCRDARVFVRGRVLAPCFCKGIRPWTRTCPMLLQGYSSVEEYLPHASARVFVRGRVLAPCFGEGIRQWHQYLPHKPNTKPTKSNTYLCSYWCGVCNIGVHDELEILTLI